MAFDWGGLLSSGAGWLLGQNSAASASNAQNSANMAASTASVEAAKIAADAARFKPIGMTNYFGSSNFTTDPSGNVTGANYSLNPYLQQVLAQTQAGTPGMLRGAQAAQGAAGGLFSLGSQYLETSPEAAAATWMQQQQDLLKPQRDQEYAKIQQNLMNTGRGGLSVAQGGDLAAANPEMAAYYNAMAQQDKQMAAQADEYGRQRTNYGAGLFTTGLNLASGSYAPLNQNLQTMQGIDQLGRGAFDMGVTMGGKNANPTGANALSEAGRQQAAYLASSPQYTPNYAPLAAGANSWYNTTK